MSTEQTGVEMIAAERDRQQNVEGYDRPSDVIQNPDGALALAAATYALPTEARAVIRPVNGSAPVTWPWSAVYFKPTPGDRVRELVKAGALIAAEIDRLNAEASR